MTAKDFFLTELPPLLQSLRTHHGDKLPKVSFDVECEIEGEGMFAVIVKNGEVSVRRGGVASPLVALTFSPATFDRALSVFVRPNLQRLLAANPAMLEAEGQQRWAKQLAGRQPVALDKALTVLASLPLRVVLAVEPGAGQRFELKLAGAEEDDPTITISGQQTDIECILKDELDVQTAIKERKLRIKGDMTTAMALSSRLFVAKK